jgi:hypothetical protein
MQTLNTLLPYLQFLAGSGSGWLASWLFDQLRDEILPLPTYPEWAARLLNVAVYRPLGARVTVFAFTALIAFGASIAVAFITGQPVLDVTDASARFSTASAGPGVFNRRAGCVRIHSLGSFRRLGERLTMTAHTPEQVSALLLEMSERATAEHLGISRRQVRNAVGRSTEHQPAAIEGVTAEHSAQPDNIWQFAIDAQKVVFEKHARKQRQAITLPNEPVAIAFLSDLHIGSAGTDYQAIKVDAELIAATPGMYAGFHGDGTDNWIVGKLTALQRGQAIGFDAERLLFESWIDLIAPKLLWWVEGNHDDWTEKLVGSSPNRAALQGARAI